MAAVTSGCVLVVSLALPAVPFVVRVTEPASVSGMEEVAETTVVPVVAEVMRSEERRCRATAVAPVVGVSTTMTGPVVIFAVVASVTNEEKRAVAVMAQ